MNIVNRRATTTLLCAVVCACVHSGHNSGQSGTEVSDRGCIVQISRRPLNASELADAGTPLLLTTLNAQADEAHFGWLDSAGSRHITVTRIQVEADFSAATEIEWGTASVGAAACPNTVEYAATMALRTDDGALDERIPGTVTTVDGLIQFFAIVPASSFKGAFSPHSTETVQLMATWSGEDLGVPGREPSVQLRKLELTDATGDVELAALAVN